MVTARKRARNLAREGQASPPLVCPLVVAQAAEIEALDPERFLTDPTKLANGLRMLHHSLGTGVIVTADGDPLLLGDPARAAAAVEATRRLTSVEPDAALAAALPGPGGASPDELLATARTFLEAGAHLLLLVETMPLADTAAWRAALTTVANVARFHQAAPIAILAGGQRDADCLPAGVVACVPDPVGDQGLALPVDPKTWPAPSAEHPVITTLGPAIGDIVRVRAAMEALVR